VKKALQKVTGDNAVAPEKIEEHLKNLVKPDGSVSRKESEKSLKKRKIPLFEQWKAAQGSGGQGAGPTGNQPQGSNPQGE
jgi:hypothetical protein